MYYVYYEMFTHIDKKEIPPPHVTAFDFQGDFASQNMMRSIARQVCEQLVNSEQNTL